MKKKNFITSTIIMFILMSGCRNVPYQRYSYEFINNSDSFIKIYRALGSNWGGVYPDTSLSFPKDKLIIEVKPLNMYHSEVGASFEEIFSSFPQDTLSIYIFCKDILDTYSWEEIQRDYKILKRYDLSIEDFYTLKNKYGTPEIPYPPTEKMRNMKMYPPYGK